MIFKEKIKEDEDKLYSLYHDLGKLHLEYEKKIEKLKTDISYTKSSIAYFEEKLHSYAFISIKEITPYLVRLLNKIEETKYVYHKSTFIMEDEEGKKDEREVHMISKYDEVEESYNVEYPYNDERNFLRDSHLLLTEYSYIEFYDRKGDEIYFMKQYPYLEYFVNEVINIKYLHETTYTSENYLKEAYDRTIEKYGPKEKVKKL